MICIGIIGFTIKDTVILNILYNPKESLVFLLKFKTVNPPAGRRYCLKVVTFKSVSSDSFDSFLTDSTNRDKFCC